MKSQLYLYEIGFYLAWFTAQVKIENRNGRLDINKHAEAFLIPLLDQIFQKSFIRLEYQKFNYPAIDLGSKDYMISIQVTSEKGFDKIANTISKFIENKLYEKYSELYHIVIDDTYRTAKSNSELAEFIASKLSRTGLKTLPKIEFTTEKNLLNISNLVGLIEQNCTIDQLKEISAKSGSKRTPIPF